MTATRTYADFIDLMVDYTDFLGRMRADESEKLDALFSKELPKIEHSITVSQANAKQLENYEARRMAVQSAAGFDGMTFRELIASAPPEEQSGLWELFSRFEKNVIDIRFYNDKSMAVARDNMIELDPALIASAPGNARANNPYAKMQGEQGGQGSMLETKV